MPILSAPPLVALMLLGAAPPAAGVSMAQVTIRQRIVIRVPMMEQPLPAAQSAITETATPIEWTEEKMSKCVPMRAMVGAADIADDRVDLIADGIGRIRVRLEDDCPGLDYYHGFYLRATSDGMICAGRDSLRTRAGDQCDIKSFRKLVAKKKHRRFRFP